MTATTLTLADFILARVAEDEAAAREAREEAPGLTWRPEPHWDGIYAMDLGPSTHPESDSYGEGGDLRMPREMALHIARHDPARVLAECESKRAIVELHEKWPVLVEAEPTFDTTDDGHDLNQVTLRMSKQFAWVTEREYRARFGTEPPTAPILRALAKPYADHPDFDPAWGA